MYNHIRHIQSLFCDTKTTLTASSVLYSLVGFIEVLPGSHITPCSVRYLYVIGEKSLIKMLSPVPDLCILYITDDMSCPLFDTEPACPCTVLTVQSDRPQDIIQKLQTYFDETNGISQWSETLLSILFLEGGIRELLETAYTVFLNPIYLFNPDFRLIESTAALDSNLDPIGRRIIENGGFSQEEFHIMNQSGSYRNVIDSDQPVFIDHKNLPCRMITAQIDSQKDMGHFVITEVNRKLTDIDLKLAHILKLAINQQLKKDEFVRSNRGFHHEFFLRDILNGKMSIGKYYQENADYVKDEFTGTLYCMVIDATRSSSLVNTMHLRALFETRFPNAMSLLYHGSVVIVFCFDSDTFFPAKDLEQIRSICEEYGVFAGMSNPFPNIYDLREYHMQAMHSISLGTSLQSFPSLFLYRQYYLEHLTDVFCKTESIQAFVHPALKKLLEYDALHHTSYANTLYCYLTCERNMTAASEMLHIHRNTLVYQMKKIDSIISVPYDDYRERQHMILSFEMMRPGITNLGNVQDRPDQNPVSRLNDQDSQYTAARQEHSTKIEKEILRLLTENPSLSQRRLANLLGETYATIRYHIETLQKQGRILRNGEKRNGKWIVRK